MANRALKSLKNYKFAITLLIFTALQLYSFTACFAVDMIIATVDKNEIYLGDVVKLNLSISDPNLKIKFPQETTDYRVVASSASSSFQIINGITSQNKTISYVIKPLRAGKINLPEATATDGSNYYKSQNIVINVQAGKKVYKQAKNINIKQETATPTKTNNVFAKIELNNLHPYVNEQLNLSLKIYHRGNLVEINPQSLQIPLQDFVKQIDDKAKEYKEVVNGREYLVYQLNYILFPLKAGKVTIPEHSLQGIVMEDAPLRRSSFDPFRIINPFVIKKPIEFKTNNLTLNVKAIPDNQPQNFTGYVGDLAVTHQVSKLEIEAGEAITLTTKIYGSGSENSVETDFIKDSQQYSLFKDKEESSEEINNSILYFEKIIKTAIVPNKNSGRVEIETLPIISFNPNTHAFEEHGKESFEINIKAGDAKAKNKVESRKEKKTEIVRTILTSTKTQIIDYKEAKLRSRNVFIVIVILNIISLILILINTFRNSNSFADSTKEKNLVKEIKAAESIAELSQLFKEFINKKNNSLNSELEDKIKKFTEETDLINYSGRNIDVNALEKLKETAMDLIKELK